MSLLRFVNRASYTTYGQSTNEVYFFGICTASMHYTSMLCIEAIMSPASFAAVEAFRHGWHIQHPNPKSSADGCTSPAP